jgi:hypothetical protein
MVVTLRDVANDSAFCDTVEDAEELFCDGWSGAFALDVSVVNRDVFFHQADGAAARVGQYYADARAFEEPARSAAEYACLCRSITRELRRHAPSRTVRGDALLSWRSTADAVFCNEVSTGPMTLLVWPHGDAFPFGALPVGDDDGNRE